MSRMVHSGNLAADGWEFHRRRDALPIQRHQVRGERATGTNLLRVLMGNHVAAPHTDEYGWKHGFPGFEIVRREDLLITIFRAAEPWLLSLYRKPWHVRRRDRNVDFATFLRQPFQTRRDMDLGPREVKGPGAMNMPIQLDREPYTGQPFANPILLRNAKNRAALGLRNREVNACFLRYEALMQDPGRFMGALSEFYDIEHDVSLVEMPTERLGRFGREVKGDRRDADPAFSDADRAFLHATLDHAVEAELGYGP